MQIKEIYETPELTVTEFDVEDIITTSSEDDSTLENKGEGEGEGSDFSGWYV